MPPCSKNQIPRDLRVPTFVKGLKLYIWHIWLSLYSEAGRWTFSQRQELNSRYQLGVLAFRFQLWPPFIPVALRGWHGGAWRVDNAVRQVQGSLFRGAIFPVCPLASVVSSPGIFIRYTWITGRSVRSARIIGAKEKGPWDSRCVSSGWL